jgi:hypothetical protein
MYNRWVLLRKSNNGFFGGLLFSYKMFRAVINNETTQVFMQRFLYFFNLNQIWNFSTDFPTTPQYQVSRKFFQCDLR